MAEAIQVPNYGIEAGQQEMVSGGRWPYLRPKEGDRARFHFLTTGSDPWLLATKFHRIGEGMQARNILCVSAVTRGEEQCGMCEIDGGQNRRNMFGIWVMLEYILHPSDNPDEDGDSWEEKKLKVAGADGKSRQRTVFMEKFETELVDKSVVPGRVRLLQLPAGRRQVWWSQFTNAWMQNGDLRKHFYELHRVGSGRDDTNYTLNNIKEDPLDESLLEREDVKDLPSIEEVFRSTLAGMPSDNSVMGSDSLDNTTETEEQPPSTENVAEVDTSDDLI